MNRDRRLWAFPAACFLAAVVVVGLRLAWKEPAQQALAQHPSPADASSQIRSLGLNIIHAPPPYDHQPCFYAASEPLEWEKVARLRRSVDQLDSWQGVVYCEPGVEGEGEHVGGWTIFGDPNLAAQVVKALR